jgi:hypothetical protein
VDSFTGARESTWNAPLASAQTTECDASQFDTLTNMWKLEPDQNTNQIPPSELAAERRVMQRVVEMFKSTEPGYVFTTLEDRANRVYVTVNPDYYDRSLPKSAPQHILIRLKRADVAFLNRTGNGPRHLESIQKLREIVGANLPEFRSMVK